MSDTLTQRSLRVAMLGRVPDDDPHVIADMQARIDHLHKALRASIGYLLNAKIDLETGATKRTAIRTIEGGIKVAEAALLPAPPLTNHKENR